MAVDAGAAHAEIDRYIVLHLPDGADQGGAGPRLAKIALIKDLGDWTHRPIM